MQAGTPREHSTHPVNQKYPASFILWEEQMLALRFIFLCSNKSLWVVGGGLSFMGRGHMHSCVTDLQRTHAPSTQKISSRFIFISMRVD